MCGSKKKPRGSLHGVGVKCLAVTYFHMGASREWAKLRWSFAPASGRPDLRAAPDREPRERPPRAARQGLPMGGSKKNPVDRSTGLV